MRAVLREWSKFTKERNKMPTAGERMIRSAREALAFARGETVSGTKARILAEIDVRRIRKKAAKTSA
jgi:hypothetical protein